MSSQITTAFVEQYKNNVMDLVQQKGSRLRNTVLNDTVNGKKKFYEQVGTTNAQLRTSRHADSPLVNTPHLRRSMTLEDYEWGDLIDNADRVRLLIDPQDAYTRNAAYAMGRAIDDVIISAVSGTSYTGVSGGTAVAWSDQDGTSGTTDQHVDVDFGLTADAHKSLSISKLIQAKEILLGNEVGTDEEMYCIVNAQMLGSLLGQTEIQSADYNSVKALVRGEIDTFLGFKFIHSERGGLSANTSGDTEATHQACWCWAKSGVQLGIGQDVKASIAPRADKSFSTYVYYSMSIGATRLEEKKIVEIACEPDGEATTGPAS